MTQRVLTLTMPVISTAHTPSQGAVIESGYLFAPYEGGWFFFVDDQPTEFWVRELRTWLDQNGFEGSNWVRIDCGGDFLDNVTTYQWSE